MFNLDWSEVLESGDAETIWNAFYSLVRDKSPTRLVKYFGGHSDRPSLDEICSEIAQEIFLRLISSDRFSYFSANGFTSQQIENEIILRELPAVLVYRIGKPVQQGRRDQIQVDNLSPARRDSSAFLTLSPTKLA
jgi:hypothetical protein